MLASMRASCILRRRLAFDQVPFRGYGTFDNFACVFDDRLLYPLILLKGRAGAGYGGAVE